MRAANLSVVVILVAGSLARCTCEDPIGTTSDAGTPVTTVDAGATVDAGFDAGTTPSDAGPVVKYGRVEGLARSSTDCELEAPPIADVYVADLHAKSDAEGRYVIGEVPVGTAVPVSFEGETPPVGEDEYSSSHLVAPVLDGQTTYVAPRVLGARGRVQYFNTDVGPFTVYETTNERSAEVTFPADAVQTMAGDPFQGQATVKLFLPPFGGDPATPPFDVLDFGAIPALVDTDGRLLRAFGAIELRVLNQVDVTRLSLRGGKAATVKLGVRGLASGGAFDIYAYDRAKGWLKTPAGTFGEADGHSFVSFDATRLGWWLVAAPVTEVGCVKGTLRSAAGTLANTQVSAVNLDAPGHTIAFTGADGTFCAPVAAGSKVSLRGRHGGQSVEGFRVVDVPAGARSCGAPAGCFDAGEVVLAPIIEGCATARIMKAETPPAPVTTPLDVSATATVKTDERRVACTHHSDHSITPGTDGATCLPVDADSLFEIYSGSCFKSVTVSKTTASGECGGSGCVALGEVELACEL